MSLSPCSHLLNRRPTDRPTNLGTICSVFFLTLYLFHSLFVFLLSQFEPSCTQFFLFCSQYCFFNFASFIFMHTLYRYSIQTRWIAFTMVPIYIFLPLLSPCIYHCTQTYETKHLVCSLLYLISFPLPYFIGPPCQRYIPFANLRGLRSAGHFSFDLFSCFPFLSLCLFLGFFFHFFFFSSFPFSGCGSLSICPSPAVVATIAPGSPPPVSSFPPHPALFLFSLPLMLK
ncbi:hypothetical protein K435DRAFT_503106 [Dendrothele bispora CBS 962.96]|uniref:Uncharacterized protein n=1 Tax=Dendrothele bispora (strain CBS 962.96) TaxID=1314807 RepID=A0A4S8KWJ0_DENBC|nr:hypothetical protein K435DRAFT_503106 [Dendrothele bispora CBS 962.96]